MVNPKWKLLTGGIIYLSLGVLSKIIIFLTADLSIDSFSPIFYVVTKVRELFSSTHFLWHNYYTYVMIWNIAFKKYEVLQSGATFITYILFLLFVLTIKVTLLRKKNLMIIQENLMIFPLCKVVPDICCI